MSKYFEELDYRQTPLGELSLRRKCVAMLVDLEVHEVKLGEEFLMTSLFHAVEDAVSDLGLAELGGRECDVVVGGLGLGYTALAALAHPSVRSLVVIDFLAPVIEWHQRGLVPNRPKLVADPRCRLVEGDFFALATAPQGFDQGRRFHAVLLDIDHSPRNLLHSGNAAFYTPAGLGGLAAQLHPDGVCVPDMRVNQEMKVLDARIQNPSIRRKQLRRREASWERSCGQNCEPTNRNVQRGRRRGRAGTTQRSPGFTAGGKARGCAAKVHSLTRGDLRSDLAGDREGPSAATPMAGRRSQQRS